MYSGFDMFITVVITAIVMVPVTLVMFSNLIINGAEERDYKNYMEGYLARDREIQGGKHE
jgi:succinate dehydrogenase hydrophobic anchor subunit